MRPVAALLMSGALSIGAVVVLPAAAGADHDTTCHARRDGVRDLIGLVFRTTGGSQQQNDFTAAGGATIGPEGEVSTRGTVRVHDGNSLTVLAVDPASARAECAPGTGSLVRLEVDLGDRRGLHEAHLTVRPRSPAVGGWKTAELSLVVDGQTHAMDGAILVVSAADGPMP
ncbi:MAG TPA: hypothetical protein VHE80_09410 [Acidimicrobiales bacterium]|nr:hypothetical protein [Acidimicrobiales bacterium]